MRPALLVVIMDFLVSSLLLFVSGPGDGWTGARVAAPPDQMPPAAEFAPAAVAEMERQWQTQYLEQFRDMQLLDRQSQLTRMSEYNRQLLQLQAGLESRLTDREAQLEAERQKRGALEAEQRRLMDEQRRQQAELAESERRMLELREQRAALEATARQLEQQHARTEAERIAALNAARDLQAAQAELESQVSGLRGRLRTQAETIGAQHRTIASQQDVIDQSLRDVTLMQARLETKTDQLSGRQEEMRVRLSEFQTLVENLPETMRAPARELAMEQQRLNVTVRELAAAVADTATRDLQDADRRQADEKLDSLLALQQSLQEELRALLERGMHPGLDAELQTVQRQQAELRDGISGLAGRLEEMETRQTGPFARLRDASLPVETLLRTYFAGDDEPASHSELFRNTAYTPLLMVNDKLWLVLHGRDLGLEWVAKSTALRAMDWTARARDGTVVWNSASNTAALLAGDPALVLLACPPPAPAPGADTVTNGVFGTRPLTLIGRAQLAGRGTRDVFLVKRHADGAAFAVVAAPDQSAPEYLKVRRALRPWANFIARRIWLDPKSQAEPGDFLVTAEGAMVGVMVDDQRCRVLDADDFAPATPLPLSDVDALRRLLYPLRRLY